MTFNECIIEYHVRFIQIILVTIFWASWVCKVTHTHTHTHIHTDMLHCAVYVYIYVCMYVCMYVPDVSLSRFVYREEGVTLPAPGRYATGIFYLDTNHQQESENLFQEVAASHGLEVRHTLPLQKKEMKTKYLNVFFHYFCLEVFFYSSIIFAACYCWGHCTVYIRSVCIDKAS